MRINFDVIRVTLGMDLSIGALIFVVNWRQINAAIPITKYKLVIAFVDIHELSSQMTVASDNVPSKNNDLLEPEWQPRTRTNFEMTCVTFKMGLIA